MQWNSLRAYAAAFSAVRTTSGYIERADDMEHLLLEGIGVCFLCGIKTVTVKYTLIAAAGRTYITACIAADAFGQLALPEREPLLRCHALQLTNFCKTILSRNCQF